MHAQIRAVNGHAAANHELPPRPFLELTELYTFLLYGTAQNAHAFMQEINSEVPRNLAAWDHPHGPEWLLLPLKRLRDDPVALAQEAVSNAIKNKIPIRTLPRSNRRFSDGKEREIRRPSSHLGLPPDMSASEAAQHAIQAAEAHVWLKKHGISARAAYDRVEREVEKRKQETEVSDAFQHLLCFMAGEEQIPLIDGKLRQIPATFFAGRVGFLPGDNALYDGGSVWYRDVRIRRRDAQKLLERLHSSTPRLGCSGQSHGDDRPGSIVNGAAPVASGGAAKLDNTTGPEEYKEAIEQADNAEFPKGPPKGMRIGQQRKKIAARLKLEHGIPNISDKTLQRHGIKRGGSRGR